MIEVLPIRLRLRAPLHTAHGELAEREGAIVRVTATDGLVGLGEVAPLPDFGTESLHQSVNQLRAVKWRGDDAVALDSLAGLPAARAALEQALFDLEAQRRGVPLAEALDANAAREVAASALLTARDPAALPKEAHAAARAGFTTVKIKVAAAPLPDDLARLRSLRAALGADFRIRVDANGGWSEARAHEALNAFAAFALELCEQPIAPGNPAAWLRLAAHGVPLAADESLASAIETEALLSGGALFAVVLKLSVLGGPTAALQLARRAANRGVHAIVTSALEGEIGRAGAAHLAAAIRSPLAHGLATGALLDDAPSAIDPDRGVIAIPRRPGLGLHASIGSSRTVECPVSRAARSAPAAVALLGDGFSITWRELDARVRRAHHALRARGVRAGDRVALLSETAPEAAALIFAAARAGACVAFLNARLTSRELLPLAARAEARLSIAQRSLLDRLPGAIALEDLATDDRGDHGGAALALDAPQSLLFTSGTTGQPKAAVLSVAAHLASARAARDLLDLDRGTRWLLNLPLFHVGGLSILHRCAHVFGAAFLHPRFDAQAAARDLSSAKLTHASLVATTLQRVLDAHGDAPPPPALRAVMVGGGPVPKRLLARAREAGFPVLQTYGLTEAGSLVTCERPGAADGASAGPPVPGTEVRIVDGEIQVRGPTLMSGYRGDEAASAAVLHDGWLRTGDLGAINKQSRLFVFSRRSDLIVSGGENVYPAEVEAALLDHGAVAEAAVIGLPDAEWGQRVAAAVVLREDCGEARLRGFLRERLAPFKQPRSILIVSALPRNAAGKIDRRALATLFSS